MHLHFAIALKYLSARKRQSIVSLSGIVLGVAFFLAISSLMQGSQNDFIARLVDNSPHITISDEFRDPRPQPAMQRYNGAVEVSNLKPLTETRGVRGYEQILDYLKSQSGVRAAATLAGQGVVTFAGREQGVTLSGMVPREIRGVTTIDNYITQGGIDALIANPNGILIGEEMARKLSLSMNDNLTVASPTGQLRTFKILGMFRTGRADYDASQAFIDLKRAQALFDRPNRANRIVIKLDNPNHARDMAATLEAKIGYKAMSWQEASEDIMDTLAIRNIIMYTVVSAVLVVAAFGIYNVISTVVMEKQRDIAILKSMGFFAREVRRIFVIQGVLLGIAGCMAGVPLGCALMYWLSQVQLRPPGSSDSVSLPMDWSLPQFAIAIAFAVIASVIAALLPARKAAQVHPVDILRGGMG